MRPAERFTAAFDRPVQLAFAQRPLRWISLSPAERCLEASFGHPRARREWRLGRRALKRLLRRLGRQRDTALLRFPDTELSLTHAGGRAVAVQVAGGAGVGIDYEPQRCVDPRIARWFLDEREQAWLAACPAPRQSVELLRLWTVKEAAFKACRDNAGLSLVAIALAEPAAAGGRARIAARGLELDYLTLPWGGGLLTLALARFAQEHRLGHR